MPWNIIKVGFQDIQIGFIISSNRAFITGRILYINGQRAYYGAVVKVIK